MTRAPARFWRQASVVPAAGGFVVQLDARPLQTPAKAALVVPTEALAAAIAAEWDAQGSELRPEAFPLTRATNSAIDRVAAAHAAVVAALAAYGESDLLCYRAEAPPGLVSRQADGWDPPLAWAGTALGAPLRPAHGVMPQPQPETSLTKLRNAVAAHEAFALTALHELVTISGSLVLGLAVSLRAMKAAEAFALSRLDETWQAEHWGLDAEAEAASERRRASFLLAARMLDLLRSTSA